MGNLGNVRGPRVPWSLLLLLVAGVSGAVLPTAAPAAAAPLGGVETGAAHMLRPVAAGHADQADGLDTRVNRHDLDGRLLPFTTSAGILDFLRTAEVVSMVDVPNGSTGPKEVLLERDGVRLHAIFRTFERAQQRIEDPDTGQTLHAAFKDSAEFEAAAYEMAMLLDLPFVPPTVRRVIDKLIDENGEDAVLFDYSYDVSAWSHAPAFVSYNRGKSLTSTGSRHHESHS